MSDPGYMQGDEGSLLTEGLGQAGRGTAEAAAVLMMAMQMAARLREKQANAHVDGDQAETQRRQDELRAELARARTQWAPAFEPDFATNATDRETLGVWMAAQPWREHDRSAADASARAEARLDQLEPVVMERYRELGTIEGPRSEPDYSVRNMRDAIQSTAADVYWGFEGTFDDLGVDETLRVWNAARPWVTEDGGSLANQSWDMATERLRELRPVAMQTYDDRLGLGDSPLEAMRAALPEMRAWEARPVAKGALGSPVEPMTPDEAAAYLADHPRFAARVEQRGRELADQYGRTTPEGPTGPAAAEGVSASFPQPFGRQGDPGAAEAAETVADSQRAGAAQALNTRDDPSTPHDERAQGAGAGADHLEYAEASSARAAGLAGQSFPKPVQSAPSRAIPATASRTVAPRSVGRGR